VFSSYYENELNWSDLAGLDRRADAAHGLYNTRCTKNTIVCMHYCSSYRLYALCCSRISQSCIFHVCCPLSHCWRGAGASCKHVMWGEAPTPFPPLSFPLPFPFPSLSLHSLLILSPLSFPPPSPFPSPLPPSPVPSLTFLLLKLEVGPFIAARGCGGALYLPKRVRRSPGRQTVFGEFQAKNLASSSNVGVSYQTNIRLQNNH